MFLLSNGSSYAVVDVIVYNVKMTSVQVAVDAHLRIAPGKVDFTVTLYNKK